MLTVPLKADCEQAINGYMGQDLQSLTVLAEDLSPLEGLLNLFFLVSPETGGAALFREAFFTVDLLYPPPPIDGLLWSAAKGVVIVLPFR